MAVDQKQRAKMTWSILVSLAITKGNPTTYKELAASLNLHWRVLSWPLGKIQHFCHKNNLPPLQALVVNSKTGLPGKCILIIGKLHHRTSDQSAIFPIMLKI
jgi:hypothetical protein